jgi:hypothetical protein
MFFIFAQLISAASVSASNQYFTRISYGKDSSCTHAVYANSYGVGAGLNCTASKCYDDNGVYSANICSAKAPSYSSIFKGKKYLANANYADSSCKYSSLT